MTEPAINKKGISNMKKLILVATILLGYATTLFAAPFLLCDPQDAVTTYILDFPSVPFSIEVAAQADGSLKYDLSNWIGGKGTFNGTLKAVSTWSVTDVQTDEVTYASETSEPAHLIMKVPGHGIPSKLKIIK